MNATIPTQPDHTKQAHQIVIAGIVALAIAMGIGRFAFTPLMPLMLRDGTIDPVSGTEWAAANYVGYLVGALTASWFSATPKRGLHLGLLGVALVTFGAAWATHDLHLYGLLLRFAAGTCSAWVLVCASSCCLQLLEHLKALPRSGRIYTGVGCGIAIAGTIAWLGGYQTAQAIWVELGFIAVVGAIFVQRNMPAYSSSQSRVAASALPKAQVTSVKGQTALIVCYGVMGFGYIIPATYLPTLAKQLVPDPLIFGLTWPLFGLAAGLSVLAAAVCLASWSRRAVWASAQGIMALAPLLLLFHTELWALVIAAILVGGTFMVATMAGLQLAREQMPENPTKLLSRMTAGFAVGQIAGPVLIWMIGENKFMGWDALDWAHAISACLLAATTAWLFSDVKKKHGRKAQEPLNTKV